MSSPNFSQPYPQQPYPQQPYPQQPYPQQPFNNKICNRYTLTHIWYILILVNSIIMIFTFILFIGTPLFIVAPGYISIPFLLIVISLEIYIFIYYRNNMWFTGAPFNCMNPFVAAFILGIIDVTMYTLYYTFGFGAITMFTINTIDEYAKNNENVYIEYHNN